MTVMKTFLRRTILGGQFVVLPVTLILVVIVRAVAGIRAGLEPFVAALPSTVQFPGLLAVFVLVLLSFIAGLLL